ncbi:MAG: DUF72 domain-containing protein [Treponema sp.]|nr:DUF72 domain-containing protein [Treponema sp.]
MSDILIGTSGYDYPEWKGVFYPPEVKRADFLLYYSTKFNAVELNNTFYNMPTQERILSFYERSEGRLQFSIKANRLLTHEVNFQWQTAADDFKKALNPLLAKDVLSAVLFQFPESFHYTDENRIYLSKLIAAFEGFPVVIEFRHKEWIRESVFQGLVQRKVSLAFCDMPDLKNLPKITVINPAGSADFFPFPGPNAYIRLHGRNVNAWYSNIVSPADSKNNGASRYLYDYSDSELESFVPVIQNAVILNRRVQVFFNNHPNGNGARNALKLKNMIQK